MKKTLSLFLVLTLLFSLLTGFSLTAYAAGDDLAVGTTASNAALEVYTQAGDNGTPALAKSYTADDLAALAETKADGYGYVYYKGDVANVVAVTEYVALDALLSDAGVTFAEGDKLSFICSDGPYTKGDFSYENIAARGVDADGSPVPTAVAISYELGNLADGTVAEIAAKAYNSGSLRFVSGMTAAEKEGQSAAGNRMPSGVVSITVVQSPALEIYAQAGETGTPALVKSYSAGDLAALAETKADGYGYVYYKNDVANATVATEYVTLDALLSDAGVTFTEGDKLSFICSDGPYTKGDFSYENIAARGVDADGSPVPTAVAISYELGNLADGTVAEIAAKAYNSGSLRFVSGMTAAEKEGQSAAGNRMPSGVVSITVVQSPALEIYAQAGETGTPALVKSYSAGDLAALAETKADGYGYVYYKNDVANATVATEYVTLDALLSDAGVTFTEGDKLSFICSDGPYTKGDFSYENIAARGVDADGSPVPTAVAISYELGNLADGTVAEIAAKAYNSGSLRFVSGMTAAEKEGQSAAGNRMPTGVISITVVSPAAMAFTDVVAGSYYEDAVAWAVQAGVTTGTSDTTFGPAADCTRKQVVTFLWRAAGCPEPATKENPFNDVQEDIYYKAILWAAENGITTGNGNGGFDPDGQMTRRDFVTFLYRYAKAEPVKDAAPFADVPAGQYYSDAVAWAAANGITSGAGNNQFLPLNTCSRAEVVTFLYRYFK
ncbi:MAG: S-layer homology domain-containing protein [Oscillospiraceae bacterium]